MRNKSTKNRAAPFFICLAAAVLWCAFTLLIFGSRYETNDDAAMANIAAGAFGEDTEYLVFCNVLFGFAVKFLYSLIPGVAWYYFLSLFLVALALAAVGFELIDRFGPRSGAALYAAVLVIVGSDLFASFQFTKNAGILLASGLFLMSGCLGSWRPKLFAGAALCFIGALIRWECIFPIFGVFGFALLYGFLRLDRKQKHRAALSLLSVLAAIYSASFFNSAYYERDESWRGYLDFNAARAYFHDYKISYVGNLYDYFDLGVMEAEMEALRDLNVYDEFFTVELFEELSAATAMPDPLQALRKFAKTLPSLFFGNSFCLPFIAAAVACCLTRNKKRLLFGGLVLLTALGGMYYLCLAGRLIERVEQVIVFAAALALLTLAGEVRRGAALTLAALSLAAFIPFALSQKRSNDYYLSTRLGGNSRYDILSADKDTLYILDTTLFDSAMGYDVFAPKENGCFSNIVFLGGWTTNAGFHRETLAAFGETSPYAALVDNDRAKLLWSENIHDVSMYITLHYDLSAGLRENEDGTYSMATAVADG